MNTESYPLFEKNSLRQIFKEKYPDINVITQAQIHKLLWLLDDELEIHAKAGNLVMHMNPLNILVAKMIREKGMKYKGLKLTVQSHYFPNRQAITFSPDGTVWFCGWAGGTNDIPFMKAFKRWLE